MPELKALDLQIVTTQFDLPPTEKIKQWINAVLKHEQAPGNVCLRIVDEDEIASLNTDYRNKPVPTNVLAFPSEMPKEIEPDFLGDIILCAPIVYREAAEQGKSAMDHFAHLIIHATLHLLDYDHMTDAEAEEMEALEIQLLKDFNITNPYQEV